MTIINRYILKNFFSYLFIYFVFISILFYFNYVYQIINPILTRKPEIHVVLKLFIFLFPSTIPLALPTTFLLSTLLTFSILNETKEFIIFQTMGIKRTFYNKNIILLSLLFAIVLFHFTGHIIPQSYKNFKFLYFNSILSKPFIKFSNNSILTLDNKKIFVKNAQDNKLQNVFIQNFLKENLIQTTFAKSAKVYNDTKDNIIFELYDGKITIFNKTNLSDIIHLTFQQYNLIIYNKQINKIFTETKSLREMTNKELLIEFNKSTSFKQKNSILTEYFLRYSICTSIIIFAILAIIISSQIKKGAKPLSFVFTALIILIYYFLLSTSLSIMENINIQLPFLFIFTILQLPNIGLLLVSVLLYFIFKF